MANSSFVVFELIFGMIDYKSTLGFRKFYIADPVWPIKYFISSNYVGSCYLKLSTSVDYESAVKFCTFDMADG